MIAFDLDDDDAPVVLATPRPRARKRAAQEPDLDVDLDLDVARDPAGWIDRNITVSELGKPFYLADYQRQVLREMFQFDAAGKLWIDEGLWSEPKKGGKTTLAACLGLWWGDTQEAPNEILVVANDLEQASSRAFATMLAMLTRNQKDRDGNAGIGTRAKRKSTTLIEFKTGSTIKAIASEYAGAAGSNHGLTLWDETWAGTTESYRRLWDELTPVPTRLNSIRLVFSYAGFEGESRTLRDQYLAGVDAAEHPEGRGERVDDALPIYRSRDGAGLNLVTYWSHEGLQPWQTAGWLARQHADHIAKGRLSTWLRLFENRWVSGESAFITAELWDALVDPNLTPVTSSRQGPVYVGLDIGIKNDTSGIVAVLHEQDKATGTARWRLLCHTILKPRPGVPVDHRDIANYLRLLCRNFKVRRIGADPSQALEMIAYLQREHLPIEEVAQTAAVVDEMGVTLITAIQSQALVVYPDADLRQQALNTVAVEKPDGMMRMDKAKSGRKIDAIVALAMALRMSAPAKHRGGWFSDMVYDDATRAMVYRPNQHLALVEHRPETVIPDYDLLTVRDAAGEIVEQWRIADYWDVARAVEDFARDQAAGLRAGETLEADAARARYGRPTSRTCRRCSKEKPLGEFALERPDLAPWCSVCAGRK